MLNNSKSHLFKPNHSYTSNPCWQGFNLSASKKKKQKTPLEQCRNIILEQCPHYPHHWVSSLPSWQFQVLFHSLFKVLFIFPSRYLFAIGLSPVFSFRWSLPPILRCSPKQRDSSNTPRMLNRTCMRLRQKGLFLALLKEPLQVRANNWQTGFSPSLI